jgi:hypothetical protein
MGNNTLLRSHDDGLQHQSSGEGKVPMNSTPSPTRSEFAAGTPATEPSAAAIHRLFEPKNDRFLSKQPSLGKRALARFLIAFFLGVAATLACQSYGDAARQMIASSSPRLGWLAPQATPVAQTTPDLPDRVRGSSGSSEGVHWFRSTMTIEHRHSPELLDSPEEINLLGPASQSATQARRGTVLKPD